MTAKPVTIQDVARRAQVSTATVSRALSTPDSVSKAKREAVQSAIQATGYRVNQAARNLRTQRSNTILALLPTLGNPFFSQVLKGIENILTPARKALIVAETQQILAAGDRLLSYLDDRRADGVIVLDGAVPGALLDEIEGTSHARKVVFACEWHPRRNWPSVRSGNEEGARLAMAHLFDLGHRRIAHVTGPEGNVLTDARLKGYLDFCRGKGIEPIVIKGAFDLAAGARAAHAIVAMSPRPSAVFCASDEIAFGLVSALASHGRSVPRDISVVGFDDIELSEMFIPALTSIRQDRIALGTHAADMLLDRLEQTGADAETPTTRTVPVALVTRQSTAQA